MKDTLNLIDCNVFDVQRHLRRELFEIKRSIQKLEFQNTDNRIDQIVNNIGRPALTSSRMVLPPSAPPVYYSGSDIGRGSDGAIESFRSLEHTFEEVERAVRDMDVVPEDVALEEADFEDPLPPSPPPPPNGKSQP